MEKRALSIVIISHAGIRQINRGVYRELNKECSVRLIIPAIIDFGSGKTLAYEPAAEGDPDLYPLPLKGRNPRTYYYKGLTTLLESIAPNVVLLENDPVSRLGFMLSRWAGRRKGRRLFCQSYENIRRDILGTLKAQGWKAVPRNLIMHIFYRYMSGKIDGVLVVNKESEKIFRKYQYQRVIHIPLGYDPNVFFPDQTLRECYRAKLKISADTILVAYFGRLVPQKGVHLLLEALAKIKSLNWMLLLDHDFDSLNEYAQSIQLRIKQVGLQQRVLRFEADHFEIANYMRAADVMVAPSLTTPEFKEQYGRAVQEAMACGCTVLVADSGHLPDLVANPMLVFEENNVPHLQEKLTELILQVNLRNAYSVNLYKRAETQLTIQVQARELLRLLWANKIELTF